jgi:hypothetical protein
MVLAAGMGDRAGIRSERGVTKARFVIRPILIASAEMARPSDSDYEFEIRNIQSLAILVFKATDRLSVALKARNYGEFGKP